MARLLILVALVAVVGLATVVYRRRVAADAALGARNSSDDRTAVGAPDWPILDHGVLDPDAACTWVIFTTPFCASCALVESDLERAFPHHAVRMVDATEQPELAGTYQVRRAPTTLLADHEGNILERLVGPEGVRSFIGATEDAVLD